MAEILRNQAGDHAVQARLRPGGSATIRFGESDYEVTEFVREGDELSFVLDGFRYRFSVLVEPGRVSVDDGARLQAAQRIEPGAAPGSSGAKDELVSKMPGKVLQLLVAPGTSVVAGTPLLILEAMKMEHQVVAPGDGILRGYPVTEGQRVMPGDLLAEFEVA
jgi:biotin carboxyl carrier protein